MLRELNPDMSFEESHILGKLKEVTKGILLKEKNRKYVMNTADIFTNNSDFSIFSTILNFSINL